MILMIQMLPQKWPKEDIFLNLFNFMFKTFFMDNKHKLRIIDIIV